jgi:hypothetical protein
MRYFTGVESVSISPNCVWLISDALCIVAACCNHIHDMIPAQPPVRHHAVLLLLHTPSAAGTTQGPQSTSFNSCSAAAAAAALASALDEHTRLAPIYLKPNRARTPSPSLHPSNHPAVNQCLLPGQNPKHLVGCSNRALGQGAAERANGPQQPQPALSLHPDKNCVCVAFRGLVPLAAAQHSHCSSLAH